MKILFSIFKALSLARETYYRNFDHIQQQLVRVKVLFKYENKNK